MYADADIKRVLKEQFGFDSFKPGQEDIIRSLLAGHDVFVLMPTGGGKSLCYQLPAIVMEGTAIVISPLIALMKNQVDAIRQTSGEDSIAHFLNSTLSRSQVTQVKKDVREGRTKLLYVAPESLTKEDNIEFLRSIKISLYAVDEAHCISEWGHDFRPEYRKIRPLIEQIGRAPIIALTATATEKVRSDIKKNLGIQNADVYKSSFNRPNLYYEVRPKTKDVDRDIIKYILSRPPCSGIIYCLSRRTVETLAEILKSNKIKAAAYHAGMDSGLRSKTQDDFLMERIDVIVATIAFGMGIDKPDVRFVIHYDIPKSLEGYYQETGRAGRDGGEGRCIAFYCHKDLQKLEKFMESKPIAEQDIGRQLLKETAAYAESSVCRRKLLLHYFGENYNRDNCGNCDNCKTPKQQVDATHSLCLFLKAILETGERYREDYLIDILMGRRTDDVCSHHHDQLEAFGSGEGVSERRWQAIAKQAQLADYVKKDVDNYGVLLITQEGRDYLTHPKPFTIVENNNFDEIQADDEPASGAAVTVDPALYQMLHDLRKKLSAELDLPPYVIFQDNALEAMATVYPETLEELQNIPGVGAGKAKRYGQKFCELIKRHCDENEIDRPEDMRIRTVANKSRNKKDIVQSIDRKVPLDEIAEAKGIEFDELLDEIESIVYSGTKINIDYFINEEIDEDRLDDIYQYFKESDTDDLDAAMDVLGEDYTEEEIRLVRIKFLSDVAN